MTAIWSFPTRIVFGDGEVARVGDEARAIGMQRPLVVTDPGVVAAKLSDAVLEPLAAAGLSAALYSEIEGNPSEANIEGGARAYQEHGADGIVAIGGGSALDAAKLIGLRARVSRPFEELDDAIGGGEHIPAGLPPLIALPTTAGTGSEVGRAAVVTLRSTGRKTVIFSPHLLAKLAILDPKLTLSLPPRQTAATGFDALTHCIEAYLAKGDHPMADAIALAGIDLVASNLPTAVARGDDIEARGAMLKAAMMGAVAFQKGLGACHSLAHPLSSECGLHHGLANALCLPAVVDFNEEAAFDRVAHVGLLLGSDVAPGACGAALKMLRRKVGLPDGLSEAGILRDKLPRLAELASQDACHRENPRPCSKQDLLALYEAAM
jgi:alcohol dehydrogenase class IV